jgi:chromate resistance exported protein
MEVNMNWITRKDIKVDRVACPWLIKRFVDPQAKFLFVEEKDLLEQAALQNAIPFDAPKIEAIKLNHRGSRCSFEAILEDATHNRWMKMTSHGSSVNKNIGLVGIGAMTGMIAKAYGTETFQLVPTSKDLGGRPPLASRCISLSWWLFHGVNAGSNPAGDANSFQ